MRGRSISEVAVSLGVDRKTIRKYLAPAVAAGLAPGGPVMAQQDWAVLVMRWFPQLADTRLRQVTWPAIGVHHDYIVEMLKAGVTQATIHQRLRDEHGLTASVASLKRYVAANLPEQVRRDQVVVLRDEADTPPGQEAQIDYGHLGYWVDPATVYRARTVRTSCELAFPVVPEDTVHGRSPAVLDRRPDARLVAPGHAERVGTGRRAVGVAPRGRRAPSASR